MSKPAPSGIPNDISHLMPQDPSPYGSHRIKCSYREIGQARDEFNRARTFLAEYAQQFGEVNPQEGDTDRFVEKARQYLQVLLLNKDVVEK